MKKPNKQVLQEEIVQLFENEYAIIPEAQGIIADDNISQAKLFDAYQQLFQNYSSLLQSYVRNTKISDIIQKKLYDSRDQLEKQKKVLYKAATIDQLTEIYNRAHLMEILQAEFQRSLNFNEVFSCIMFDIDDFKQVNDSYGHPMGDEVIKRIATIAKGCIRGADILGRYGGEEYLIVLPKTSVDGAMIIAEKIREQVGDTIFKHRGNSLKCTISLGISDSNIEAIESYEDLIFNTDSALYQAKQTGKNKTAIFGTTTE